MLNTQVPTISQEDLFKVQLLQSLSRASNIMYEDNEISYNYNNEVFVIKQHKSRIIREPGYEILLEGVLSFTVNNYFVRVCAKDGCFEIE